MNAGFLSVQAHRILKLKAIPAVKTDIFMGLEARPGELRSD